MRASGLSAALIVFLVSAAIADTTAFLNVNVVPMDEARVLSDHVVLVEDQTIIELGPRGEVDIPDGATIVDGGGGYLMPGLADMHMHLVGSKAYSDPEQLLFFLAQGTTTIRVLGAPPITLEWRKKVQSGELVGPTIYAMGPTLVGNYGDELGIGTVVRGLNAARIGVPVVLALLLVSSVRRFRSRRSATLAGVSGLAVGGVLFVTELPPLNWLNPVFDAPQAHVFEDRAGPVRSTIFRYAVEGYDGIKLYDGLTGSQFLAGAAEAKAQGLYSIGHLLNQVPLEDQLASGLREVAHVDEFLSHHWVGYNMGVDTDPAYDALRDYPVDAVSIPQTVDLVVRNGVAVVSNLSTDEALYRLLLDLEGTLAEPRFSAFRPDYVQGWKVAGRHFGPFAGQGEYRRDEIQPFLSALVKALHDAGVPITTGTDAGGFTPEGSIPSDIHRELELLVEAGLSSFEALSAGTAIAGYIIGNMTGDNDQGTIDVGKQADLILLSSNPLEDVSATRRRMGVMANGHWYRQTDLDKMVDDYLASRDW
ncbi:MAG: amidohydrolase family protein [Rhodobacter sp.]|nr:amidohydrolase family protein [Rhodobacter sp.]